MSPLSNEPSVPPAPAHSASVALEGEESVDRRGAGTYLFTMPWDLGSIGGVSQVVAALMEELRSLGSLTPALLVNSWEDQEPREVPAGDLRQVFMRVRPLLEASRQNLSSLLRYALLVPRELLRIRRFVRAERVSVVNAHFPTTALFTWFLARAFGGPRFKIVMSLHGLEIRSTFERRGLERWLWSWMLRRADAVVACSNGLQDEIEQAYGLPANIVRTIHNGIDPRNIGRIRSRAREAPVTDRPYLCNVGTFEPKKAHDVLLQAFAIVAEQQKNLDLVMIGRRGETSAATRTLIEELGLGSRVRMLEDMPHAETLAAIDGSRAFVLASRVESFAIVLLEAGALGKAVVATQICGVEELLEDGRTGRLSPPEDPATLAQTVLDVIEDEPAAEALGRSLREHVDEHFSWHRAARAYLDVVGHA